MPGFFGRRRIGARRRDSADSSSHTRTARLPVRLAAAAVMLTTGCATYTIKDARVHFYKGRADTAAEKLEEADTEGINRSLLHMERGTIYQAMGAYRKSIQDYLKAQDTLERFQTYSVSKGAASMVANDLVQEFYGYAYERTMVPVFAAHSYLALGDWENAAVEARKAIKTLDPVVRGDAPHDAYTHYLIGLCFELIDDVSNAALHYRKADALNHWVNIDERGRLRPASATNKNPYAISSLKPANAPDDWNHELICIVMTGEALTGEQIWSGRYYVPPKNVCGEIGIGERVAGCSFPLTDLHHLAIDAANRQAALKLAKTATRVAIKDAIADGVSEDNPFLGELIRLILIGILEQPDTRRWETLPRYLGVARIPCPPDLDRFTVRFKNKHGTTRKVMLVEEPIMKRRNIYISICRDISFLKPLPAEPLEVIHESVTPKAEPPG